MTKQNGSFIIIWDLERKEPVSFMRIEFSIRHGYRSPSVKSGHICNTATVKHQEKSPVFFVVSQYHIQKSHQPRL